MSLSIIPIVNRVKIFDITKQLKQGENVIAIEAYSYDGFKGAINIYGQLQLKGKNIQEVITDKTWLSNKKELFENDDWQKLEFDDTIWKGVKSYGRPPKLNGDLFISDILKGKASLTQDYFGAESYFYGAANTLLSGVLGYLAKKLGPKGIKILQPYG